MMTRPESPNQQETAKVSSRRVVVDFWEVDFWAVQFLSTMSARRPDQRLLRHGHLCSWVLSSPAAKWIRNVTE
jgi:hypothetical protein